MSMDFFVGGMPRGGTTVTSNLFNAHPDAFCYSAETHWLPFLLDVAGAAPVSRGALPGLRDLFERQNRHVLVEMVRYNVERGAVKRMLLFEEHEIPELTARAIELLRRGLFGRELLIAAAGILRERIHRSEPRAAIGEKTPSNIFAFRAFGALEARAAFMVVREPFAVVQSMRSRGQNPKDPYAAPFRGDLIELAGLYLQYLEAIAAARVFRDTVVVRYEDLLRHPRAMVASMFAKVRLSTEAGIVDQAAKRVRVFERGNAWEKFSPGERTLILSLTGGLLAGAGYDDTFFAGSGLDRSMRGDPLPATGETVLPVYGFHPRQPSEHGRWLGGEACLAVVRGPGIRHAELSFRAKFPSSVLARGQAVTLEALDAGSGAKLGGIEMGRGTGAATLRVDLVGSAPVCEGSQGTLHLVKLRASHAFRTTVHPETRLWFRSYGRDHRELSFQFTGHRLG